MRPAVLTLTALGACNLLAWMFAWSAFADRPALLGSALLAWLFGLRHAADADHLAAIDNVVRKLMQDGQRPRLVGLYFSLGHSTVVILASAVVACTASDDGLDWFQQAGGLAGTLISALFLLLIALANLYTLAGLLRGGDTALRGGVLARVLAPALNLIRRPAHMYPLGFLFGLGFDTATEIGLLALAATQAAAGVSFAHVLIFPALFTAGMALVDTADSVLMVGAYGWAFIDAGRKRTYNIAVTLLSIIVAVVIGGMETVGLLADRLGPRFAAAAAALPPVSDLGYVIAALFACTWGLFAFLYHRRKPALYDPSGMNEGPSGEA